MKSKKIKKYFFTIVNLKFSQVYFRIFYFLRNKFIGRKVLFSNAKNQIVKYLNFLKIFLTKNNSFDINSIGFTYLNKTKRFKSFNSIQFDFFDYGELWCYNLNYFDFLIQDNINLDNSVSILNCWINKNYSKKNITWDPYPTSLRLVNLIKWYSKNYDNISNNQKKDYLKLIINHQAYLRNNIEYHLDGNHLLENYISLFISSAFTNNLKNIKKDYNILLRELDKQFLTDGFHYELSIMYHNILTERLMDVISILLENKNLQKLIDVEQLKNKISDYLYVSKTFVNNNGKYPSFNDVIRSSSCSLSKILNYSKSLGLLSKKENLNHVFKDAGYVKSTKNNFQLFFDFGKIGPKHIPGHGHCDTFSFELNYKNKPIIVNLGTSTYEYGKIRYTERSTRSHNTVYCLGNEQDEIWSRFRVARQHKIISDKIEDSEEILYLNCSFQNYNNKYLHNRILSFKKNEIEVNDFIETKFKNNVLINSLHFHPDVNLERISERIFLINNEIKIIYKNFSGCDLIDYEYAIGYSDLKKSFKIESYPISGQSSILIKLI